MAPAGVTGTISATSASSSKAGLLTLKIKILLPTSQIGNILDF